MKQKSLLIAATAALTLSSTASYAGSIESIGDLPGGSVSSYGYGISNDGKVIVGSSISSYGGIAFRWEAVNGITDIDDIINTTHYSQAYAANSDGSVVVGFATSSGSVTQAFRWTSGTGMVGLGFLSGDNYSIAFDVNNDGSVIVGQSSSSGGDQAFRWASGVMTGLGYLDVSATHSYARAVSGDGTIVVGSSEGVGIYEAFRWTSGTGMVGIGDLAGGGYNSNATNISTDGTVIVGSSDTPAGTEAFRWTSATGMIGLGDLTGGSLHSVAHAASANGTIVVGEGDGASGTEAFRWTAATGITTLSDALTSAGADLTGWFLTTAASIDDSGNIITGQGTIGGDSMAFLANTSTGAITTVADLSASLSSAIIPSQQARSTINNSIDQSLFAATQSFAAFDLPLDISHPSDIVPAAGEEGDASPSLFTGKWSGYMVGSFGIGQDNDFDNNNINGTIGILFAPNSHMTFGGGVISSHGQSDMSHGGQSDLDSKGGSMVFAYKSDSGFRLYSTAFTTHLSVDTKRNYINGAGIDTSYGDTNGMGYGLAFRSGWEFPIQQQIRMMPYGEMHLSRTALDAYTETSGGFPASLGKTSNDQITSRLGTEISYDVSPTLTVSGRATWAHRLTKNDDGPSINATGFTGTLTSEDGDRNWAEGTIATKWHASTQTTFNTELTGRTGETQDPVVNIILGAKIDF